jgi:hypothetical protein
MTQPSAANPNICRACEQLLMDDSPEEAAGAMQIQAEVSPRRRATIDVEAVRHPAGGLRRATAEN